jgi:hypothetical protein
MKWWWGALRLRLTRLVVFFIVLDHWNNSLLIDMSPHSDTLSWFRDNQTWLFLLNAACLAQKKQIPILWSLVWSDRGSNPRSTALEASTLVIFSSYVFRDVQHTIFLMSLEIRNVRLWHTLSIVHIYSLS